MFYSHEILTSRKYGVATIWLVATLGQNSSSKKIGRKAILDVNVAKACEILITPETPLALRLQSNLLYGISKVYSQQCGYVLSDAQNVQNNIRHLMANIRAENLDTVTKAKPQDLILQDDPALLSDMMIPLDVEDILQNSFAMTYAFETQSSIGTGKSASQHSQIPGIIIPSDSSFDGAGGMEMTMGGMSVSSQRRQETLLEVPLFNMNEFGEIVDDSPVATPQPTRRTLELVSGSSGQIQHDRLLGEEQGRMRAFDDMDLDLPLALDGEEIPDLTFSSSPPNQVNESNSYIISQESEEAIAIPLRKKRTAKIIPLDRTLEFRNTEMIENNRNYIQNMLHAQRTHLMHQAPAQSKKNADYFILGRGIGSIGTTLHPEIPHPLSMFSGNALFEWATGKSLQQRGQKRESSNSDSEGRNVRSRQDDYEHARHMQFEDDGLNTMMQGDEIEHPREAGTDLEDISSAMPWNISASLRGSSVPRGGSVIIPSSTKKTRLVSASPLQGRGNTVLPIDEDGYQILEDAILESIHSPTKSPTLKGFNKVDIALDGDSYNFFRFIKENIETKQVDADQLAAQLNTRPEHIAKCTFEDVLPTETNSRKVAAHGLLHVLSLATKNLIKVNQSEYFGDISITVA